MNYLVFDIECSDGYHICSFGYVLANENMEIIEKKDIVINPESRFVLSSSRNRPKINLAYSEEYFLAQKCYSEYYDQIKELVTRNNQIIFGHSIISDFYFLKYANKRYNLEGYDIVGYDTQKIYQKVFNKEHVESLEKIINELNISLPLQFHKSSDDAHATFLVAKEIARKEGINLTDLSKKYHDCLVESRLVATKEPQERFSDIVDKLRKEILKDNHPPKIAFSEIFKIFKKEEQVKIVEKIFKSGYDFTTKIVECDIYVRNNVELERDRYCKILIKNGKHIQRITLNQLLKMIDYKIEVKSQENFRNKLKGKINRKVG